jgi:hypothetical protein
MEGRKKKKFNKNGNNPTGPGVDPRLAGDRWSPAGDQRLDLSGCPNFFEIFL